MGVDTARWSHLTDFIGNLIVKKYHFICAHMYTYIHIISEETSIFAPQRLPFYKALGVAACTVGKVRASTVFICVFSTFRPSDFLLFVKNGFVVGVRCQGNSEPPADGATTPMSQFHAWLRNAAWLGPPYTIPSAAHQHCIHTRCILSCTAGGRRAARGKEGERENRRWEGRRKQGAGGREEAMI